MKLVFIQITQVLVHFWNRIVKKNQDDKVPFIKGHELKITQVELLPLFVFKSVLQKLPMKSDNQRKFPFHAAQFKTYYFRSDRILQQSNLYISIHKVYHYASLLSFKLFWFTLSFTSVPINSITTKFTCAKVTTVGR